MKKAELKKYIENLKNSEKNFTKEQWADWLVCESRDYGEELSPDNIVYIVDELEKAGRTNTQTPDTFYKEYERVYIGGSDIASLTIRAGMTADVLDFNCDGSYDAYLVDENAIIGDHYKKVGSYTYWIKIYDDDGLEFKAYADLINIYRAGDFGCIIQLIGEE